MEKTTLKNVPMFGCPVFLERIRAKQADIHRWLEQYEHANELPLYSSVDIRDAGFKIAVVDTNLFPAGFNNLCEHGLADSVKFMKEAIDRRAPGCRNILIISEEHTRNTWYLENIRILQQIIQKAGFQARIATFLTVQPEFCDDAPYSEFTTATGAKVRIHCFKSTLSGIESGKSNFDLIIMNNDLSAGIPEVLKNAQVPIYPSIQAGWHARLKSHHFGHTQDLVREFADILNLDPWLFSCEDTVADNIDVHRPEDREKMAEAAGGLFERIDRKYKKHGIEEKPYIVVKSDSGTYGMGVMAFESVEEILQMNRKQRNKLHVGKGSRPIGRYLLQEGVPTITNVDQEASEVVIYQIENNLIGGFYRSHAQKGTRDNLNAKGMEFKTMCPHLKKYGDCGVHHDVNVFDIYRILARIAAVAAHREIVQLENNAE